MKKIFTLLTSLMLGVTLFAADTRHKSMLAIKSLDRGDIRVVLDGRRFEPGFNSVIIRGVDAGYHTLRVYRERTNGYFNIFGRRYEMVYSTSIMIRPRTNMSIIIDRFGRTSINETRMHGYGRGWNRNDDWGYQRDNRDRNNDRDKEWNDDRDRNYDSRNDDFDRNGDHEYDFDRDGKFGDYDSNYGYGNAMSDREFNQVLQSISKEWLESNKLKSATQIVTSNMVTTAQVRQLMQLFGFETNKLDVAKQAYRNTVDKKNYYLLNDMFSFSSSKDELARYIRSFR